MFEQLWLSPVKVAHLRSAEASPHFSPHIHTRRCVPGFGWLCMYKAGCGFRALEPIKHHFLHAVMERGCG